MVILTAIRITNEYAMWSIRSLYCTRVLMSAGLGIQLLSRGSKVIPQCAQAEETNKIQKQNLHIPLKKLKKDCEDPVCKSTSDMFAMALKGASITNSEPKSNPPPVTPKHCPLDINQIGNSTWDLIHTLVAYYPENPSAEQKDAAIQFFQALSLLYPCHICAEDFQDSVAKNPPKYAL